MALVVAPFLVGLVAPPALATSWPGNWVLVFGNSSSCALGRASVNDTTHKAGATTVNRHGCDENAAAVSVPAGWLVAAAQVWRPAPYEYYCSSYEDKVNPTTSADVVITSTLVPSAYCPATGVKYQGFGGYARQKAAGGFASNSSASPAKTFY